MKVKVLSGVLIFSLALNLAVLGTFLYFKFNGPSEFKPDRMPDMRDMSLSGEQREKMRSSFREFRKENRKTMEKIFVLEDSIAELLKEDDSSGKVDTILQQITELKMQQSKTAIKHFSEIKEFLSPEQQEHFFDMIIKHRPSRFMRDRVGWKRDRHGSVPADGKRFRTRKADRQLHGTD